MANQPCALPMPECSRDCGTPSELPKVRQSMLARAYAARNNIKHDIVPAMWEVIYLAEAGHERAELPTRDRVAVDHAVAKLEAIGPALPYPHSSNVEGSDDLRELRPQAGKSPWRPLYRQVGAPFVVAAIGPEAKKNKRGFDKACQSALDRLAKLEEDNQEDSEKQGARQDHDETQT
jgi:hypothetical protein